MNSFFLPLLSSLVFIFSVNLLEAQDVNYIALADSSKVYLAQGDYATAILWLERGVKASQGIDFSQYAPTSEEYQAFLHLYISLASLRSNMQRDFQGAFDLFEIVYQTNEQLNNFMDISQKVVIDGLLIVSYYKNNPQQELEILKRALAFSDKRIAHYKKAENLPYLDMTKNQKMQYLNNGLNNMVNHQYAEGILYLAQLKQAILIANEQTLSSDYLHILSVLSNAQVMKGELTKSLEYLQEASNLSRGSSELYYTHGNMHLAKAAATYYYVTGNYFATVQQYQTGIKITQKVYGPRDPNVASMNVSLGKVYTEYGQFYLADSLFSTAQEIYAQTLGTQHQLYTTTQIMLINNKLNQLNLQLTKNQPVSEQELFDYQLEQSCKQLIQKRKEELGTEHMEYSNALLLLANLYTLQKNYVQALALTKETFAVRQKWLGPYSSEQRFLYFEIARLSELTGDIAAAVEAYRVSNQITLEHLRLSFAGMTEQQRKDLLKVTSYRITCFYSFAHRHLEAYPELAEDVFNNNLVLKGLSLETGINIKSTILASKNDSLIAQYQEWNRLKEQLLQYQQLPPQTLAQKGINLSSLQNKIYLSAIELARHSSSLETSISNAVPHTFQELKGLLKEGEVLIDFVSFKYHTGENWQEQTFYYACIIQPEEDLPILVKIAEGAALQNLLQVEISASRASYISDNVEGEYLYQLLWQPLEPYLLDAQKIYLSPSGLLHKVAFGALLYDYYTGNRLLEQYQLHYLSTARDFFKVAPSTASTPDSLSKLLLVGGVDFGTVEKQPKNLPNTDSLSAAPTTNTAKKGASKRAHAGDFQYLYGTQVEIDNISQLLQKDTQQAFIIQKLEAEAAQEGTLKQLLQEQNPKILHIASHGFFFEEGFEWQYCQACKLSKIGQQDPLLRSGIALAQANKNWAVDTPRDTFLQEDGLLTAYEVSNLNLSATDLVVLSACETGRGDISNTEGVMGLQRAFKIAGCRQMILSLWKVPDQQTAELMALFYTAYAQGTPIPQAFRQAQLSMSQRYDNPYYWAAFILIE